MSDPDHDGWPDKYSDPRERPHPDVLRVTVESFDEAFEDTLDAVDAAAKGEAQPAVVSFPTVSESIRQKIHPDNYKYTKIAHGESREKISRLERYSDVVSKCLEICFPESGIIGRR